MKIKRKKSINMITVVAKSVIKEEMLEQYKALAQELVEKSRKEEGCIAYNLNQDINNKTILAHCIHIKEEEKELLRDGNVVHNPESNMNNAVGYCDVLDLVDREILVD